jgi:two-component system sensor histidine kinase UhpB
MSLRGQVFLSVVVALLLGLSALAALAFWQARRSVEHEMDTALEAADRVVDNALLSLPRDNVDAYLARLVASFDGNRHVRVSLTENGRTISVSHGAPYEPAPAWFINLLQIPADVRRDVSPRLPERAFVVASDPHNEISESWLQFRDGALILGLFSLVILCLLYRVMARVNLLLGRLITGFEAVGGGDYAARLSLDAPKDLAVLSGAFNRMAERLNHLEDVNQRMRTQIQVIQEEERADLARDLHDEMGPFLFAVRVEADAIARQTSETGIAGRAHAIGEAVTHIQAHVRNILKQLRQSALAETGLGDAIGNLITFFERRHAGVTISLDIADAATGFPLEIDEAIYRMVQEALTNAARHSGAGHIWIGVSATADAVTVAVEDDGNGFSTPATGMGLRGMRERLAALSGHLTIGAREGGGARLVAIIPRRAMAFSP